MLRRRGRDAAATMPRRCCNTAAATLRPRRRRGDAATRRTAPRRLVFAQVVALFKQLHFCRNQAIAQRVSLAGLGMQCLLDAALCVANLLLCAAVSALFSAFATVAFFELVVFCVVEMRYLLLVWQAHDPQRDWDAAGWQQIRRELAAVHARVCGYRADSPWRRGRGGTAAATWIVRGNESGPRRGRDVDIPWRQGGAAAATWIFRGDESRRRRGRDVDIPWRWVASAPRPRAG